ncbi:hypothetical protein ABIA39_001631 [Nocardia sp. GAS34]|uniref:DUF6301 family protein n=1 Tax=unclassified Nocardia TaxID=2637762 RepID=UPI003D25504C
MTELRVMTDTDVSELAVRLAALKRPLLMAGTPQLAAAFGWTTLLSQPDSVLLDTGIGLAGGQISGHSGYVDEIEVLLTDHVGEGRVGPALIRDAFVATAAAITAAIGAPTSKIPGESAEIRWAGTETTLRLMDLTVCVKLFLLTNEELASQDVATELDERDVL